MKERRVVLSPEVRSDLLAVYEWIAGAADPVSALRYIDRIEAAFRRLGLASERGTRRDELRTGLRTIGFERRATIAFMVEEECVTVLRFFYGGQDWTKQISESPDGR